MLVPVLTPRSGAREPAWREIPVMQRLTLVGCSVEEGHRHGAGMHPSPSIADRHPLDAMASDLVAESFDGLVEFDGGCAVHEYGAVQSAASVEEAAVGCGELGDEEAGVVAAFAGADLDYHWKRPCRWVMGVLSREIRLPRRQRPVFFFHLDMHALSHHSAPMSSALRAGSEPSTDAMIA